MPQSLSKLMMKREELDGHGRLKGQRKKILEGMEKVFSGYSGNREGPSDERRGY